MYFVRKSGYIYQLYTSKSNLLLEVICNKETLDFIFLNKIAMSEKGKQG